MITLETLKKRGLDDKHIKVLGKFATLQGELLKGRVPIKGKDSKGCRSDQFVDDYYRMHDLIRGIYAMKKSNHALSIMIKDEGRYGKEITYFSPKNWHIQYNPPTDIRGKRDTLVLKNCMDASIPIGVLRNIKKSVNEVLGLGKVINFQNNIFSIVPYEIPNHEKNNIKTSAEKFIEDKISNNDFSAPDSLITTTARIGQQKFRKFLMPLYNGSCAFCGFNIESFLIASHIVPHSEDHNNRLNPRNGLLLCRMCDNAFERGLIKLSPSLRISKHPKLTEKSNSVAVNSWLCNIKSKVESIQKDYSPHPKFIRKRNQISSLNY